MKLIVFSDIHGNSYALDAFTKKINDMAYDYLIFCGDIFGYYYNQKEVIERLSCLKNLIWLKGNHDEYFLKLYDKEVSSDSYIQNYGHSYENVHLRFTREEAAIIAAHDAQYVLQEEHCRIGIFHGAPDNKLEGRLYPNTSIRDEEEYKQYDIVILGHTHCRMVRTLGHTLIINSGSLGQPRDGSGYGFACVDTELRTVTFENVYFEQKLLYEQIDSYDKNLMKLKSVLERRK